MQSIDKSLFRNWINTVFLSHIFLSLWAILLDYDFLINDDPNKLIPGVPKKVSKGHETHVKA